MTIAGARTPEELDTLFEDAAVLRDPAALAQLFDEHAVLVARETRREVQGRDEIARAVSAMWAEDDTYVADPRRILQVGDTALVLGGGAVHVVRRDADRSWRYAISLLDLAGYLNRAAGSSYPT